MELPYAISVRYWLPTWGQRHTFPYSTSLQHYLHLRMRTQCVYELLMARDGLWSLSDVRSTRSDFYGAIAFLCTYLVRFYEWIFFKFV